MPEPVKVTPVNNYPLIARFMQGIKGFAEAFTGDAYMGPQEPVQPRAEPGEPPRIFQYMPGANIALTPRSGQPVGFQLLRETADGLDILRIVIEKRKSMMKGLEWDITALDPRSKADLTSKVKEVKTFLHKPDKDNFFDEWLGMLLEDVYVIDAPAIYKHRTNGGKLWALELVDGATIKLLIDTRGRLPDPPVPAYQQILYGQPNFNMTKDELIYRPKNKRTKTVYGFPPVEYLLLAVDRMLRRQLFDLAFYTEGNMPEAFGILPESFKTVPQIQEFQEYWDRTFSGDAGKARKMKFMPSGFDFKGIKERSEGGQSSERISTYEEMIARTICAAFEISPQAFIKMMNRATSETAEDESADMGLDPDKQYVKRLLDEIIQNDLGHPDLQFIWVSGKDRESAAKVAKNEAYVRSGILSIDEVRQAEGLDPIGIGNMVMTGSGPVLIKDILNPPEVEPAPAPAPGEQKPPEQPAKETKEPSREEVKAELTRWHKVVTKAMADGKPCKKFESSIIPASIYKHVENSLMGSTRESIDGIFKKAKAVVPHKKNAQAYEIYRRYIESTVAKVLNNVRDAVLAYAAKRLQTQKAAAPMGEFDFDFQKEMESGLSAAMRLGMDDSRATLNFGKREYPESAFAYAKKRAAGLVGKGVDKDLSIIETTRDAIKNILSQAVEESWDLVKLTQAIQESGQFTPYRAELISRTEMANAYNTGSVEEYKAVGVEKVLVFDGQNDDVCKEADGKEWSMGKAASDPTAHPNCVRAFGPIPPEEK